MQEINNNVKENNNEFKYDYKFDIINFWLTNKEYQVFIKKLFDRIPDSVNVRSANDVHLLNYLLEQFIISKKIELFNRNKPKIGSNYLYGVIISILENDHLFFSSEDFKTFYNIIGEFKKYLSESEHDVKLVNRLMQDINKITLKDEYEEEIFDIHRVNNQLCCIDGVINMVNQNSRRKDLTNENTFVIINDSLKYNNYSYIVNKIDDNKILVKVNIIDIDSIVMEYTPLDLYLKEKMFSNVKNEEYLFPTEGIFDLGFNKKMPTLTIEYVVNKNGEVTDFDCYQSVSVIDTVYNSCNSIDEKNMPLLNKLFSRLNKVEKLENELKNLDILLSNVSIKSVAKYFDEREYPLIYKVQEQQDTSIYEKNLNALNGIFYKLDEEEFRTIYSIICEDYNYSYYSIENKGHENLNAKYYLDLLNPLDSYVAIQVQRLIKEFYLGMGRGYVNENTFIKLNEIVDLANRNKVKRKNNKQKVLEG